MTELIAFPNKPKTNDFKMDAVFNSQNDNLDLGQGPGWRTCNLTCCAMLVNYLRPKKWLELIAKKQYTDFANIYQLVLNPFGDTTDHDAQTKALASLGVESYFTYTASLADLSNCLYNGVPAVLGSLYKQSGHMILAIGRDPNKIICHNPYGYRNGITDQWIQIGGGAGANEDLSFNWMKACFIDQGPESGWMRVVTHVDSTPTGTKLGM